MSALGHKLTFAVQNGMSALPPTTTAKADSRKSHVRFTRKSRHVRCTSRCLLWDRSGHQLTRAGQLFGERLGTWRYLQAGETGQVPLPSPIAMLDPAGKCAQQLFLLLSFFRQARG
jgi:hypothetical protein